MPARFLVLRADGPFLAVADGAQPVGLDAQRGQVPFHGIRPTLAQRQIVLIGAPLVAVALDLHLDGGVRRQPLRVLLEHGLHVIPDIRLVEVKVDRFQCRDDLARADNLLFLDCGRLDRRRLRLGRRCRRRRWRFYLRCGRLGGFRRLLRTTGQKRRARQQAERTEGVPVPSDLSHAAPPDFCLGIVPPPCHRVCIISIRTIPQAQHEWQQCHVKRSMGQISNPSPWTDSGSAVTAVTTRASCCCPRPA